MSRSSKPSCGLIIVMTGVGAAAFLMLLGFVASSSAKARISFTRSDLSDMLKAHAKKSEVISRLQVYDYKPWLMIDREQMSRQGFRPDQPKSPTRTKFTEAWTIDLPSTRPWEICGYDHEAELWFDEHDRLQVVRYSTRPQGCF